MAKLNEKSPLYLWLGGAAVALLLALPVTARAQVVVVANGSPITEYDIQQRTKLIATSTHKHPTRKEIISALIDDRLKIAKAKSYGLEVSDKQVSDAFENMAKRQGVSVEKFTQFLQHAGVSQDAVKARIRAELTWGQLIRGKYGPSLQVTEADIANAMRGKGESDSVVGYVYTLYPVTVVVPTGSPEAAVAAKRREAENLRSRFDSCRQGLALARSLRDVAVREPITRASADLPKPLQDLLGKMEIGHLTTPDVTAQGFQMFALCNKKQTKAESPLKRQIRDQIYKERFEADSKQFLEEIRKSAMIEYK
jgi:peptidyl-prolyl cis-trans isomerase SurA